MHAVSGRIKVFLLLIVIALTACGTDPEKPEGFVDETAGIEKLGDEVTTQPLAEDSFSSSAALNGGSADSTFSSSGKSGDQGGPEGTKTIYFMYNSSQVKEEFVPVIEQHAQYLKANPSQHLLVGGHTDERGSREYNIALGEQRAKSILRMLTLQGVTQAQLEVVSYGEEKPADFGHDESAWQLNRRVELDYQGQ